MRTFRGPRDPDDSDEGSDPDEIEDGVHAVFMAPELELGIDFNVVDDEEVGNPGVHVFHVDDDSNNGPIFIIDNDNQEDYEPSTDSDDEPLEYDSVEESDEDSDEEEPNTASSPSINQNGIQSQASLLVSVNEVLPYADASDSDDLSSLDSASDSGAGAGPDEQTDNKNKSVAEKRAEDTIDVESKQSDSTLTETTPDHEELPNVSTLIASPELDDSPESVPSAAANYNGRSSASSSGSDPLVAESPADPPVCGGKRKYDSSPNSLEDKDCKRFANSELEEDEESENKLAYSNPMASDLDGMSVDEEAFRGDRIGNSTYAERNVLKILMRWIQDLEKYTTAGTKENGASDEEKEVNGGIKLERDFDKELSLLWDMSSENDVMNYLVEKDIFQLLQNTLISSACDRLSEIALGILANLLSSSSLLNTFPVVDEKLRLVDQVITVSMSTAHVPILIQAFAVFRRVVWYIRNVEPMENWLTAFTTEQFVTMVNFLMKSSTNVLLLGDLIVTMFSLFETLSPNGDQSENRTYDADKVLEQSYPKYDVFCQGGFVSSLCEGLGELLKYPDNDFGMKELIDDVQVPPGHIQTAIRYGLGCLCYLHKVQNGRMVLRREKTAVTKFLIEFHEKFHLVTDSIANDKAFEYLVSGLSILAFCHCDFPTVQPEAIIHPITAACTLKENEEVKRKNWSSEVDADSGTETMVSVSVTKSPGPASTSDLAEDIVTSIGIVVHEHLAELSDTFGPSTVQDVLFQKEDKRLTRFVHFVEKTAQNYRAQQQKVTSND